MQDLIISLVQANIVPEKPEANLKTFGKKLDEITVHTDVIFLPEMFNTGFPVDPKKFAENTQGRSVSWLKQKAKEKQCAIVASLVLEKDMKFYNSLIWMHPDGDFITYSKRHVFQLGEESEYISPGEEKIVLNFKGWNFCPQICYDLRFPVWSKNGYQDGQYEYDVLFYIANWPHMRNHHWIQLLIARAIENQAYVIGVNRVGKDKNRIDHTGDSMVINPEGKILYQAEPNKEDIQTLKLSYNEMADFRKQFNVALDWDRFEIK